ncbi:MAG: hypothetical protein RIS47_850 [Bacteroidota bacterium]|jgi:hemerythrin-like domain-containing protein
MQTATANLENDHVQILRLIDVMEQLTKKPSADTLDLNLIVSLIRNFADGLHHNKEEKLLFPKMVEKGFSFEQGPVAVMMQDHVIGRSYVKGIADNIAAYENGNQEALATIYTNINGYADLLRAHIAKENNILFRMADKAFTEAEQEELLQKFATLENEPICNSKPADCVVQIEQLAAKYLIS